MTKKRSEFDIELMIPALRRAGLAAEMLVLVCTVSAGISAASFALIARVAGGW